MLPDLIDYATSLAATFRVADLVDVLVVSALVYGVIRWLKTSRSRFVLIGLVALLGVYLLARILEMRLTLFLFQVGLTVALVALVVIFQEEVRRTFERIATSRLLGTRRERSGGHDVVDTLVAATAALARQRTGALLVIRGREPLERHVTGGIALDGRLSEALIQSVFDTHSPGHDGALLVENGLASRFGVHLPLSTAVKSNARFGTRHTAALGLCERSDALVLVVSEERGTVSAAQNGELVTLKSSVELKQRLVEFFARVIPERLPPWYERWFVRNLGSKIVSVVLACAAWLVVSGYESETYTRTITIPVVYKGTPDGFWLEAPNPLETHVTLHGTQAAFRTLDARQLTAALDMSNVHSGTQRRLVDEHVLDLPKHLSVRSIDPSSITVVASKTSTVSVPVKPQFLGQLPTGLKLTTANVQPPNVLVVVRNGDKGRIAVLRTEPIALEEIRETTTLSRRVAIPGDVRLATGQPEEVHVAVAVAAR